MENLEEIIWFASWPVVIYVALKFISINLEHYKNMEKLEDLEAAKN